MCSWGTLHLSRCSNSQNFYFQHMLVEAPFSKVSQLIHCGSYASRTSICTLCFSRTSWLETPTLTHAMDGTHWHYLQCAVFSYSSTLYSFSVTQLHQYSSSSGGQWCIRCKEVNAMVGRSFQSESGQFMTRVYHPISYKTLLYIFTMCKLAVYSPCTFPSASEHLMHTITICGDHLMYTIAIQCGPVNIKHSVAHRV